MFDEWIALALHSEKGRHVNKGALLLMGALCVYALVSALSDWHGDWVLLRNAQAVAVKERAVDDVTQLMARIPEQHLFGTAAPEDTDFLPITSLQVRVTGIVKSEVDTESRAMISQLGAAAKVYRVDDELTSGITIKAINADNVILEHNGRLEKLPLARAPLLFQGQPKPLWQNDQ